jgi:hypothetical protein
VIVGLVARADNRGLGHVTWEFSRHLAPSVLVVDVAGEGFPTHLGRYPGATVVRWRPDGFDRPDTVREWVSGCDVVYSAETFYDWRIVDWCRAGGVATVLHVMPELFDAATVATYPPTVLWAPTGWRLDRLPADTLVVPVPVALDRWPIPRVISDDGPLRILHVAGRRALADRNGTTVLARAMRHVTADVEVTVTTQDTVNGRLDPRVNVVRPDDTEPYWALYGGHDVLVLPRRYGGLSLPVQEAAGAGLAVVLPDCAPNAGYPAVLTAARPDRDVRMVAGLVPLWRADERAVAAAIDRFAADRDAARDAASAARCWAERRSWGVMAPVYREALEAAVAAL